LEYSEVVKVVSKHLCQSLASKQNKFNFNSTEKMRDFIVKMQSCRVLEVVGMHNKFLCCLVANLYELFDSEPIKKIDLGRLNPIYIKPNPLIFINLESLTFFQLLAKKTMTNNESVKYTLSRVKVPNFIKNINIVFSSQFKAIVWSSFRDRVNDLNVFSNDLIKFHIEIEESDEVYGYKTK
jgi:hypothetical protein